jgi:hypothetical protein
MEFFFLDFILFYKNLEKMCWAHACNPSYSGGRHQEDCGLKPAQANSLQDPIWKNTSQQQGWWSGSRCRPCVQTPVPQKRKKERKKM